MPDFAILTNAKRTRIALIHSVIFWLIALRGATSGTVVTAIWSKSPVPTATIALITIYAIVSTVLITLTWFSRCIREKLYFVLCSSSASVGFVRYIIGDANFHLAIYLRVLFLSAALITCVIILRQHSVPTLVPEPDEA
jgi:hypothetical protein